VPIRAVLKYSDSFTLKKSSAGLRKIIGGLKNTRGDKGWAPLG